MPNHLTVCPGRGALAIVAVLALSSVAQAEIIIGPLGPISPKDARECAVFQQQWDAVFAQKEEEHRQCLGDNQSARRQGKEGPGACDVPRCQGLHDVVYGSEGARKKEEMRSAVKGCYAAVARHQQDEKLKLAQEQERKDQQQHRKDEEALRAAANAQADKMREQQRAQERKDEEALRGAARVQADKNREQHLKDRAQERKDEEAARQDKEEAAKLHRMQEEADKQRFDLEEAARDAQEKQKKAEAEAAQTADDNERDRLREAARAAQREAERARKLAQEIAAAMAKEAAARGVKLRQQIASEDSERKRNATAALDKIAALDTFKSGKGTATLAPIEPASVRPFATPDTRTQNERNVDDLKASLPAIAKATAIGRELIATHLADARRLLSGPLLKQYQFIVSNADTVLKGAEKFFSGANYALLATQIARTDGVERRNLIAEFLYKAGKDLATAGFSRFGPTLIGETAVTALRDVVPGGAPLLLLSGPTIAREPSEIFRDPQTSLRERQHAAENLWIQWDRHGDTWSLAQKVELAVLSGMVYRQAGGKPTAPTINPR